VACVACVTMAGVARMAGVVQGYLV